MSIARTLKVGDTAYIAKGGRATTAFTGVVKRVTPTGQVTVQRVGPAGTYDVRFSPKGDEIGSASAWYCDFLISKERYDAIVSSQRTLERTRIAQGAVAKLAAEQWGSNPDVPALLKRIDELRALVQAISA